MKILEVHYSTASGGAERVVLDLCNELSHKNDVYFCQLLDDKLPINSFYMKELEPSVHYVNLGCKSGNDIRGYYKLLRLIFQIKPDVVHAHTNAMNLWLPSLLYKKCKYFHTLHNLAQITLYKTWLAPIYKYFYKTRIIPCTISDICTRSYHDLFHLDNAITIDNGRASLSPSPLIDNVSKEINRFRTHPNDKVFIHVARCCEQKNQKLLFDTFKRLFIENRNALLLVIGEGYDDHNNQYLLENAAPNTHWLGPKNNVCDYLISSDFFILSSAWEGLPISLLEAMSVGLPAVCTPAGGIPDVIKDASLGYLAPSMDEEDFYKTVILALETHGSINKKHLIEYFENNFSMRNCAYLYEKAFIGK